MSTIEAAALSKKTGFKKTEIETPPGWEIRHLGEIASIQSGGNAPQEDRFFLNGTLPFIRVQHFDGAVRFVNRWALITKEAVDHYRLKLFPAGSIVFPKSGASINLEKRAMLDRDSYVVGHLAVAHANEDVCDNLFLYFALRTMKFASSSGGTTLPFLNLGNIANKPLLLPPLAEQRAIAAALAKIQASVETQDKIVAKLRELKAGTMLELFGARKATGLTSAWKREEIGKIATLLSGGTPSKARLDWWTGSIPWASSKDLKVPRLYNTQDHITEEAARDYSTVVPRKTILLAIRGMALAKNIPVAITEVPMAFNQDLKAIVPNKVVDPDFLYYAIESAKTDLDRDIGTTAHGTRRLGSDEVAKLKVPVPPPETQKQIARTLRCIENREMTAAKSHAAVSQLFSSTLTELMSGSRRLSGAVLP